MPQHGIPTLDLATAKTNLENALRDFSGALKNAELGLDSGRDASRGEPRADARPDAIIAPARNDTPVFAALREWRTSQARAKHIPPYIVATDEQLRAIEASDARTLEALGVIRGMSENRLAQYGTQILEVLAKLRGERGEDVIVVTA